MGEQDQNASGVLQEAPLKQGLEQHLRARVWKDEAYRQEVLANPKAVLQRDYAAWFLEGKIPSELTIKVIEEEEHTLYLILPSRAPDALLGIEDIDEADVSMVAGASGAPSYIVCITHGCTKFGCTKKSYCKVCN